MTIFNKIIESNAFQNFIIGVIIFNGIILGVQTNQSLSPKTQQILDYLDQACLFIFVVEILLKLIVFKFAFFKKGWNVFDFIIVAISLIPTSGGLSILRAFRIFRVLRLVTAIDSIRRVVSGMLIAIPGVGSVAGLLLIVFYIGAVISTTLFGEAFPDWFGSLSASMYTLFQIMTLESWSMGIVRPVMDVYPYSWVFFIPFITATSFTVLNLFIGIIVDAMATVKEEEQSIDAIDQKQVEDDKLERLQNDVAELNKKVQMLLDRK